MVLSDGATSARFNLGVYVLTTPDTKRGEDPATYDVTGYDLASLLQNGPADTYEVASGTTYIQAARDVVTASGIGAQVLVDGTRQSTTLPATMVWALTDDGPSWLRILTDLFAAIAYEMWIDENGNVRARPYADVAQRPVEWTLDTSDAATNIVGEDRTLSIEAGDIANWWRFVQTNRDTARPRATASTPCRTPATAPRSQAALGRTVRKFVRLDAADQADPRGAGRQDRRAGQGRRAQGRPGRSTRCRSWRSATCSSTTTRAPRRRCSAASWSLNLDGSAGHLQLGGAPPTPADPVSTQAQPRSRRRHRCGSWWTGRPPTRSSMRSTPRPMP